MPHARRSCAGMTDPGGTCSGWSSTAKPVRVFGVRSCNQAITSLQDLTPLTPISSIWSRCATVARLWGQVLQSSNYIIARPDPFDPNQFNLVTLRDSRGCEPARSGPVRRRGRAIIRIATLLAPCAATIFSQPGLSCSGARSNHHGGLGCCTCQLLIHFEM